jgi:hypothetical protein
VGVDFMSNINLLIPIRRALAQASIALTLFTGAAVASHPVAAADLEGVWRLASPQTSLKPADGVDIPFTEEGRRLYEENRKAAASGNFRFDFTETRCSSPGLPRMMLTPMPMKIFQRSRTVSILFQWNHLMRQIDLTGEEKQGRDLEAPSMKGFSSGHWDGDTLVVESHTFLPQKLLDNLIPSSEDLTLTESMRLRDHNTLEDRIRISDPQMFTGPWETVLRYKRASNDLFPFPEDICLDRIKSGLPLPR